MALVLVQTGGFPLLVPDYVEAGAAPDAQCRRAAEQRRRLHLRGQHPQALPGLPLGEQLVGHGHTGGAVLAIEGVLALNDPRVPGLPQGLGGLHQGGLHLVVGHGGELDGGVLPRGPLVADGPGGNDHIVALDLEGDAPAGAHPDEGMYADGVEFLHSDNRRGTANACGTDTDLLPQEGAGVGRVLAVGLDLSGLVKIGRDFLTAAGVPGQKAVPPYVPFLTLNMKLKLVRLHGAHLSF